MKGSAARLASLGFLAACALLGMSGCEKLRSMAGHLFPSTAERRGPPGRASRPRSVEAPRLAIILDDLGGDQETAETLFSLHYPLTVSILPNQLHSVELAEEAHRKGFEILLHLPMQSRGGVTAEAVELDRGMTHDEVRSLLGRMLESVPHAVGINNHQGSLATSDRRLMAELMAVIGERGLFFVDSRTTPDTVAFEMAKAAGVPTAYRNVPFLDDVQENAAIHRELEKAKREASEKGAAIAICHPHPATLRALEAFLPELASSGVRLVPVSELVH